MYKAADILLKTLTKLGVDTVFGYPGSSVLPVYDRIGDYPIRHILTAHEQGASFAASGYARSSGKTGVVLATSGPGATNLVTGIADAFMDSVPLVAITGNVKLSELGHDCFQEVDIFGITMPIVKYSYIVTSPADLEKIVLQAFKIAHQGRKGPVLIDIPFDVLTGEAEYLDLPVEEENSPCDLGQINEVAKMINESQKPFLFVGGGAISSDAFDEIKALNEKIHAKVGVTFMALGSVDSTCDGYVGIVEDTNPTALDAIKESDLIISLGVRFSNRNKSISLKGKKMAQIDVDKAEIDKNVPTTSYLLGDLKTALGHLLPFVDAKDKKSHGGYIPVINHRSEKIISALGRLCPDAVVVTDVGLHQICAAKFFPFRAPRTFLTSGGLGVMGFGMGAAIGAALSTGKKIILITGDGSLRMNIGEFETAVKLNIPLTVLCFNNSSLGLIKRLQKKQYKRNYVECELSKLDFAALADCYGGKGFKLSSHDDIEKTLTSALNCPKPVIVDCEIPQSEI